MDRVSIRRFDELAVGELYALLRLRVDVFVVEQNCAYPELDGRDAEAQTLHLWTADDRGPTAYLRLLGDEGGLARIGRVCTRSDARGSGRAGLLMHAAIGEIGARPAVLSAQSRLSGWYERFGFVVDGPEYVEDRIPHVPMRRVGSVRRPVENGSTHG